MRIVCPACDAQYDVPDTVAEGGRKVRCARCHTVWEAAEAPPPAAEFPSDAPAEPPPPETAPDTELAAGEATMRLFAEPPLGDRARSRGAALVEQDHGTIAAGDHDDWLRVTAPWIVAWVLSLTVIGAAAWAGYHWRADVIRLWPATERLYAVLAPPPAP